jgi:protease I
MKLQGKKILLIIAFHDFQDHEYGKTREILENQGAEIKVASSEKPEAQGKFGTRVKVDLLLSETKVEEFEAVVFIGGPGAVDYREDPEALRLAKEAFSQNKILAAICIAPTILARAGVLQGKKATVWSGPGDKEPIRILEEEGAAFVDQEVVQDGKIITANGPGAAEAFAETISRLLV